MAEKKYKLKTPKISLTRVGYNMVVSFGTIDEKADYIYVEKWVYEKQDLKFNKKTKKSTINKAREYKKQKLGSKQNSSWSFSLDKEKSYYPFKTSKNEMISKIVVKVWVEGNVNGKNEKSASVSKTYKFDTATVPTVGIAYEPDNDEFYYVVDINDDYRKDSESKKVTSRVRVWLTSQSRNQKSEVIVSGHEKKWYDKDMSKDSDKLRKLISKSASPDTPIKYTVYAYCAGPGGDSDTKSAKHIFARPLAPKAPTVTVLKPTVNSAGDNVNNGFYDVSMSINQDGGWRPVDKVTIQYRDQNQHKGASDIYGEDMGSWSIAKDNVNASMTKVQTDDLGAVAADSVRYFRLLVEHDGVVQPSYVSDAVAYGKPSNVSGISVTQQTVGGKPVHVIKWTNTSNTLYGTKNGQKVEGETLRMKIYLNSTASDKNGNGLIKTIYYGDSEWNDQQFVYDVSKLEGQTVQYIFRVYVRRDDLNPGAMSDLLYSSSITVPRKVKNVKATKLSNNTTVELTWENPIDSDTVENGVEVAWSTFPNAFESNSQPSTVSFDNGAMEKAYITGLTAGEYYYFWVRLYNENDNGTDYGIWSDISPGILMSDKPDKPILTTSRTWVREGGTIATQWTYSASGDLPQSSAQIEISKDKSKWTAITHIVGEDDKCSINFSNMRDNLGDYTYLAGDYFLRVVVKNSMGNAESDPVDLLIATKPTCTLISDSIVDFTYTAAYISDTDITPTTTVKSVRSLPITVNATGEGDLSLYIYCIDEYEWEHPDVTDTIFIGDCVWTSEIEAGEYTINDPNLADNSRYRLQLECVDPETLMAAEPQYLDFEVHWEHQAVAPANSTVEVDENGVVTLTPVKPVGATDDDVCDIYRVTADGRYLCMPDVKWGKRVRDVLPTFGENSEPSYCFCTRTPEGDEDWTEIEYELGGYGIIINYGGESINLICDVTIDDNRTKQGEVRTHLGGTKTYYGKPFIDRKQSISTKVIKVEDADLIEQLYDLSRYTGICYVRTSSGLGYAATVDVSINQEYNNKIVSVSISATEADDEGEYFGEFIEET